SAIAGFFFRHTRWLGASPLGDGHINDTYRIDFEENGSAHTFVLQRINTQVFRQPEQVMHNLCAIADHLATQPDYPLAVLSPVATLSHAPWLRLESGDCWRVFPYLADTYAPKTIDTPRQARLAASAYGAFARAMRHFPAQQLAETIPGFHDTDQRWAAFEKVLHKNPAARAAAARTEIAALQAAKPIFDRISQLKRGGDLPVRVTHNDTKAGNILLDSSTHEAVAVIDLDTVMPGTLLSDFGDMVRTFVPDRYEDDPQVDALCLRDDVLKALTEGFLSQTADFLTAAEREHLMLGARWIVGEQALRFLTDYLAGDVYYKISHPQHNLLRARNQLKVLEQLMAHA
ncbi:MAG TPA: aminoglycoside phosphotransferase family protein, partial [Saprospiraceae bacterium]|nr:aminoglycoside phosphotransferase family protein [Saprospiraceae bacterium]